MSATEQHEIRPVGRRHFAIFLGEKRVSPSFSSRASAETEVRRLQALAARQTARARPGLTHSDISRSERA